MCFICIEYLLWTEIVLICISQTIVSIIHVVMLMKLTQVPDNHVSTFYCIVYILPTFTLMIDFCLVIAMRRNKE